MFDLHRVGARARHGSLLAVLIAPAVLAACAMPLDHADPSVDDADERVAARTGELSATPGTLDPSFGARCVDTRARFSVASAVRAQLLPDGKILAATTAIASDTGASELGLVRFLASGALDTSFGSGGYVRTGFGDDTVSVSVEGLALAPDGKIVLAGSRDFIVVDPAGARSQPTVIIAARFASNGALDPSFGQGGKVQVAVFGKTDRAAVVLVQPDGKVLIGGQARLAIPGYNPKHVTALVRFNGDGTLDAGFGQRGIVTTEGASVRALGLEANGNILAASPALQRFSPAGAPLGAPFAGTLTSITAASFTSFALQADGKRVVSGSVRSLSNKHARIPTVSRVTVAGASEFVTPGFNYGSPITGATAVLQALLVQSSGRIIVGGSAPLPNNENGFGLAAVHASGAIDTSFGGPQGLFTRISASSAVTALVQQTDGKLVALGFCENGLALARYFGP